MRCWFQLIPQSCYNHCLFNVGTEDLKINLFQGVTCIVGLPNVIIMNALLVSKPIQESSWVNQRSNCLGMSYDRQICLKSVTHCWCQKSSMGHLGSTGGQNAQEYHMATKFGPKNPRPESNTVLGSKVIQVSSGSTRGRFAKIFLWTSNLIRRTINQYEVH